MVCSVVAPLQDALDRSRLEPGQVDCCLLMSGSSRIPQVARAVQRFLPNAVLPNYSDHAGLQTAVARGAAFHALTMELFGRGVVQPVCYDSIALRTETGIIELVPRGAALPYPRGRTRKVLNALAVPKTSIAVPLELKVEIVAGREQRCLYRASWFIPAPVSKGDPLSLSYRYDENQVLDIHLMLDNTQECFSLSIENPLTHVVNPQNAMVRVLELEEQLRTESFDGDEAAAVMTELAEKYADLGQKEKAIAVLKRPLMKAARLMRVFSISLAYTAKISATRRGLKSFTAKLQRPPAGQAPLSTLPSCCGDAAGSAKLSLP
jgi:molecular chaperone DnaK